MESSSDTTLCLAPTDLNEAAHEEATQPPDAHFDALEMKGDLAPPPSETDDIRQSFRGFSVFEKYAYSLIRERHLGKHYAIYITLFLLGWTLPLLMTQRASFGRAREVCSMRRAPSDQDAGESDHFEALHAWTFASTLLLCLLEMLFFYVTPLDSLTSEQAKQMDRKIGGVGLFLNVTLTSVLYIEAVRSCTSSGSGVLKYTALVIRLLGFVWLKSFIVHAYLFKRAKIMVVTIGGARVATLHEEKTSVFSLHKLRTTLKWEMSLLYIVVPIAAVVYPLFGAPILRLCGLAFGSAYLVVHVVFSVISVVIFLEPVLDVLRMAGGRVRSSGHTKLRWKKFTTLFGVSLLMTSNTLLLLNLLFVLAFPEVVNTYLYLNPDVIGFNLDAILTILAIGLVSGGIGRVLDIVFLHLPGSVARFIVKISSNNGKVKPIDSFEFNSNPSSDPPAGGTPTPKQRPVVQQPDAQHRPVVQLPDAQHRPVVQENVRDSRQGPGEETTTPSVSNPSSCTVDSSYIGF